MMIMSSCFINQIGKKALNETDALALREALLRISGQSFAGKWIMYGDSSSIIVHIHFLRIL